MAKTIHVILIDSTAREIRSVEYNNNVHEMQRLIGGYIEVALTWPTGDVLYVDEDGLNKPQAGFFRIAGRRDDQPLAGNGLIIGKEVEKDDDFWNEAPVLTVTEVQKMVRFFDRAHVDSWGKANASEPAVSVTSVARDGTVETEVLSTMGHTIGNIPKVKP